MISGNGGSCYRFLYLIKAPGCAPLRRARFPALAAPALLPSARSALPPPTRAHNWIGPGHETRTKPAASRGCLRRGRSDSGMGGAPFASAGRSGASVVGLPSRPPSTQAEPSSRGPGRQGRSYSGALHLDALNHDRSTTCGSKADGMGAGASGGLERGPDVVGAAFRGRSWVFERGIAATQIFEIRSEQTFSYGAPPITGRTRTLM